MARSDVVTFHHAAAAVAVRAQLATLRLHGRPILCPGWLRRGPAASTLAAHVPLVAAEGVGWYVWSLVNGRSQTHLRWGSPRGAAEPERWSHDLLRPDGRPHDSAGGSTSQGTRSGPRPGAGLGARVGGMVG